MFYDVYERLCKEKGEKPYALPMKLGAKSNSMVAQWQKGSVPRIDMLQKIADYFDVSVGYLLDTEKEKAVTLNNDDLDELSLELVSLIRHLSDQEKRMLLAQLKTLVEMRGK